MWYILNITSHNEIFFRAISILLHAFPVSVSFHDIISCDVINKCQFWNPFTPVIKAGGIDPTQLLHLDGYSAGDCQALQLIVLATFGAVD